MVNSYFDHPHASQLGSFLDERKEIPKNASPSVGRQNNGNLDLYLLPYLVHRRSCSEMSHNHADRCAGRGRHMNHAGFLL